MEKALQFTSKILRLDYTIKNFNIEKFIQRIVAVNRKIHKHLTKNLQEYF